MESRSTSVIGAKVNQAWCFFIIGEAPPGRGPRSSLPCQSAPLERYQPPGLGRIGCTKRGVWDRQFNKRRVRCRWCPGTDGEDRAHITPSISRANTEPTLTTSRPLLLLAHPPVDQLIDGRFNVCRRYPLARNPRVIVVHQRFAICIEIATELFEPFEHAVDPLDRASGRMRRPPVHLKLYPERGYRAVGRIDARATVPVGLSLITRRPLYIFQWLSRCINWRRCY
jgi:hypothetical protein